MNAELVQRRLRLLERRAIDTQRFVWMGMAQEPTGGRNRIGLWLMERDVNPWGSPTAENLTPEELSAYDILPQIRLLVEAYEPEHRLATYFIVDRGISLLSNVRRSFIQGMSDQRWEVINDKQLIASDN